MIPFSERPLCRASLVLFLMVALPSFSSRAQVPTPTPTPRPTPTPTPTPVPSPTPRPTSRPTPFPTPTPTPGAPQTAPRFEVSGSEVRREPFSLVGRVESTLGDEDKVATGAVAGRRLVISAAEVLWSEETGFASRVVFQRGQMGADVLQSTRATFIVVLSAFTKGEDSDSRVNSNMGALLFKTAPAQGKRLDLQPSRDHLTGSYRNFMLGYFASIGNGRRMGGISEISFRRVEGTPIFRPKNVKEFPALSLGAPVFHGESTRAGFRPLLVGTVVSSGAVRGFSARQIRDFQED